MSPNPSDQKIPPVVIQTWETNQIRAIHALNLLFFRWKNPDLSFKFLSSRDRDSYMESNWNKEKIFEVYHSAKFKAMQVDIFRYCYLYEHGGYYFDISKAVKVPITSLHSQLDTALISFEKNLVSQIEIQTEGFRPSLLFPKNLIIQWGFGFTPRHEVLRICIDKIEYDYPKFKGLMFASPREAILRLTGPVQFTRAVWEYAAHCNPGMRSIRQAGIDFYGKGIYSMLGSGWRHIESPSYWLASNCSIC